MKRAAIVLAALIAALALPFLIPVHKDRGAADVAMPWQIELPGAGQSRVFGLLLGAGPAGPAATLADARRRFGGEPKLAIVAPEGGSMSLEAYYDSVEFGPLTGKLVLTLDLAHDELGRLRERSPKHDYMGTGTKQHLLAEADRAHAETLPLRAVAFIPAVNLDEAIVLQRFGAPAERLRQGDTLEHFLYPDKGLDLVLDAKGKEVLQYVAPARFDALLRQPLRKNP